MIGSLGLIAYSLRKKINLSTLLLFFCLFWYSTCLAETVGNVGADNSKLNYKIGTIPARANASAPTWTEANTVPLSVDLSGNLRTLATANPRSLTTSFSWTHITTNTTTQLIALSGVTSIKVYDLFMHGAGTTASAINLVYGTGVNCGIGTTQLTGPLQGLSVAGTTLGTVLMSPNYPILVVPSGQALCAVTASGSAWTDDIYISYIQE